MRLAWTTILLLGASQSLASGQQTEDAHGGPAGSMVLPDEGYVGSASCAECHRSNHASWKASNHSRMTQAPSREAVLAPFEGLTPFFEGTAWALANDGRVFYATPIDTDGQPRSARTRLALTTGSHHYQIYWLATPAGTLEQLPLVWHRADERWVPRSAMFLQPPALTAPETDRWQLVCIKCHTTNGTPSHSEGGATRVAELGISCEACHGPGEKHVAWRRLPRSEEEDESGTGLVNPAELDHVRSTQVCGQCHGIHLFGDEDAHAAWIGAGFDYRPGADLAASRNLLRGEFGANTEGLRAFLERKPDTLSELFWSDGHVRVSGREYNGMVESPCYQRGEMSCLSCHEMHVSSERVAGGWTSDQLRPGRDGSVACLGCHADYGAEDALQAHTHHAPESSGSDCLNCHMPYTTYGLTKGIRSHTIASPDVATTLATGRPNACNQCHLDRSLGWTAERLGEWYGHQRPELSDVQESTAAIVLQALSGDAGQRALAAWNLGWAPAREVSGTGWMPYLVSTLLLDEYDAVRWIAMHTVRLAPNREDFSLEFCAPLELQRDVVRATILADWMQAGLSATEEQRSAVLVDAEGKLDAERFQAIYAERDNRPMLLAE